MRAGLRPEVLLLLAQGHPPQAKKIDCTAHVTNLFMFPHCYPPKTEPISGDPVSSFDYTPEIVYRVTGYRVKSLIG